VNQPLPDVRWRQRFANFRRALQQLESFFDPPPRNEREQQGLIKAFEYSYELGWNSLRDLLLDRGATDLIGSRDTLRQAFRSGLIEDGEGWMRMIQDRNLTSHTYNRSQAEEIAQRIETRYLPCFQALRLRLGEIETQELEECPRPSPQPGEPHVEAIDLSRQTNPDGTG
jgi:nucleotidyltransferase substrate binding protein (TIGR01987 family)